MKLGSTVRIIAMVIGISGGSALGCGGDVTGSEPGSDEVAEHLGEQQSSMIVRLPPSQASASPFFSEDICLKCTKGADGKLHCDQIKCPNAS